MSIEPSSDSRGPIALRVPRSDRRHADLAHSYRLAGELLVSELALDVLTPFEVPTVSDPASAVSPPVAERPERVVFAGRGWVGDAERWVECRSSPGVYLLEVSGIGRLRVSAGDGIDCLALEPEARDGALAATLLGPALILALALRRTYCFHASAVAHAGRAVAILGGSGYGKSTLAARLHRMASWHRLADDVLPVATRAGRPSALPGFPQLKLSAGEQTAGAADAAVPLAALYLLHPASTADAVRSQSLTPAEATLSLCRHTVASKLFGPELAADHLRFCARVAEAVPVRRLVYPKNPDAILRASRLLLADLSSD